MNYSFFIDFLNCLYVDEVEIATRTSNQERLAIMGLSADLSNTDMEEYNRRQAQRYDLKKIGQNPDCGSKNSENKNNDTVS